MVLYAEHADEKLIFGMGGTGGNQADEKADDYDEGEDGEDVAGSKPNRIFGNGELGRISR